MAPRRQQALQVSSSSDVEDEGVSNTGNTTIFSAASSRSHPRRHAVYQEEDETDDDEDVQVLEGPSSAPPLSSIPRFGSAPRSIPSDHPTGVASSILDLARALRSHGVQPSLSWLEACISSSQPGILQLALPQQAEYCFSRFLMADLNSMGTAVLPPQIDTLHATELAGPFVLQVDEIVDIGSAIRNRYRERPPNASRCLKLSMTDGIQRVYGFEYRPTKDLKVLMPAGFKIAIHHVSIRRGVLMLVPEVIIVLGGHVEYLEAARQRAVQHVNKPPRGIRVSSGGRGMGANNTSLAEGATLAAWPANNTSDTAGSDEGALRHADNRFTEHVSGVQENISRSKTRVSSQNGVRSSFDLGEQSSPFTYLALLFKNDQPDEHDRTGRIKCVLTGVKEFQFKNQDEFKLVVYVDDGSEIMALHVDHPVVEALVGCSPRQVSAALASSNASEVVAMKATLSRFQAFLTRFEGILVLQKVGNSRVPVVREMIQGIENSQMWSILRRLQSATREDKSVEQHVEAISISP